MSEPDVDFDGHPAKTYPHQRSCLSVSGLEGKALLIERINERTGHFFDPALLRSQLDVLELTDYGHLVDITPSPSVIASLILE